MKKLLQLYCLLGLILPAFPLFSQQKECVTLQWSKHFGGSLADAANDVAPTQDGGFVAVGYSRSSDHDVSGNLGKSDFWVVKVDSAGSLLWQKNFGGSLDDVAASLTVTSDGSLMVIGSSNSADGQVSGNHGEEDVWLLKLSGTGNLLWSKTYGGTQNDRAEIIRQTADGGFVVAGYAESGNGDLTGNAGDFDYWIFKIDAAGNLQWQKNYGGSNSEFAFDVREIPGGGYLLAGSTFSTDGNIGGNNGFYDYWLLRLDAAGQLVWERNFGGNSEERAYALTLTADGGAVVVGTSNSTTGDVTGNNGNFDYWIMKVDANADLAWAQSFGGLQADRAFSVAETGDGGFVVAGTASSGGGDVTGNHGSYDAWLVKLDAGGIFIWEKTFGGSAEDQFEQFLPDGNGGFIAAGYAFSGNGDLDGNYGDSDFWLARLTADSLEIELGNDTTLCAGETLLLQIEPGEDYAYLWKDGSTDTTFLVKIPGDFWLEIDRNGCKARDTVEVKYASQTPLDLGADTILCEGETLVLKTGIPGAVNLWQDGSTGAQFPVQNAGEYWVSVKKDGCEYLDTIQVDFTTVEVELGNDTLLCDGTSLYLNVQLSGATYLWQDGSQTAVFEIKTPGDFWVKVAQGGCQKSDSISVEYQLSPDTILPDFTTICEKEILPLDASQPDATYRWHDGTTEPVFVAKSPGKYAVEVKLNGCVFKDEVNLVACENCLYVPNAFSPNGDGFNDEFQAFPGCPVFNFQMQIFDRWGSLVFVSEDPAAGWDGTKKGKKAVMGTYVYWISFQIENNHQLVPQERKGGVTLVR